MELHARLVHAEAGHRVVEVRASRGEHSLGSAVAEAATAHEAEELAVARLLRRLQDAGAPASGDRPAAAVASPAGSAAAAPIQPPAAPRPTPTGAADASRPPAEAAATLPPERAAAVETPAAAAEPLRRQPPAQPATRTAAAPRGPMADDGAATERPEPPRHAVPPADAPAPSERSEATGALLHSDPDEEPPADPEDWSQELTAVDLQLRRLGWSREQEGVYLQRAFGHPSRSRLTRYGDLRAYLMALEGMQPGSDPALAAVPLRRSELLAQGDALLRQLGWSAEQGRAFLERQLERVSRQQLSDVQLLQFNMLLEGELLAGDAAAATTAVQGAQR